jgi:SAM-dependent methyltransferase
VNPEEYLSLNGVEEGHWFYQAKREIARYWLDRFGPIQPENLLVDCGAGTGRFAQEMSSHCRVLAIDDHAESLELAQDKLGSERVRCGSCTNLPLPDQSAEFVTALDVLEHIDNDSGAVAEIARILKTNGIAVITVPALAQLWSDWDIALQHFRRYSRTSLRATLSHPQLRITHLNYINVFALPGVWLARALQKVRRRGLRFEDQIPPAPLNALLRVLMRIPACQNWLTFPAGVGLLAVVQKV